MRNSGRKFSRLEAEEVLRKCHLLRDDIDRLMIIAMKALRPRLHVVSNTSHTVSTTD
jgi:hypothetical protein